MALFNNALPAGFEFDGYRVERVLGAGSFGITYLAEEVTLGRKMAIKEYLPSDIAMRASDGVSIQPIRSTEADTYEFGLEQFIEEARTLVRFQHPNIVPFHRLVEANGTCYVVMEYQEGQTLGEILAEDGTLDGTEIRLLLLPLLDGLDEVHRHGFLHRDIKPDNIFIREDGRPMLIDFGAAREALSRHSLKPTAILTPGFAPFEQYSSEAKQGPYTDIYAMGATLYRAAFGKTPPESTTRMLDDTLTPAVEAGEGRFGETLLAAIDAALAIQPADRPQTVADWQAMIAGKTIVAADSEVEPLLLTSKVQIQFPLESETNNWKYPLIATLALAFIVAIFAGVSYLLLPGKERLWPVDSRVSNAPTTPPPTVQGEARKAEAKRKAEERYKAEKKRTAKEKRLADERRRKAEEQQETAELPKFRENPEELAKRLFRKEGTYMIRGKKHVFKNIAKDFHMREGMLCQYFELDLHFSDFYETLPAVQCLTKSGKVKIHWWAR